MDSTLPSGVLAACGNYVANSNGHLSSWNILINSSFPSSDFSGVTFAHEFGHAFGLKDLYDYSNRNKLMYGYESTRTATKPKACDLWGAKVITGNHTSHSWSYRYTSLDRHQKYCTSCGGYKTQGCTFNSSGNCTKCGHHQSASPDAFYVPFEAMIPPFVRRKMTSMVS